MKFSVLGRFAASLACLGMLVPQAVLAQAPGQAGVADVALAEGGVLAGQLVNAQGAPIADAAISIQFGQQVIARATTDAEGRFAARDLRGGMHLVVVDDQHAVAYRLWAPGSAPPAAGQSALVVSDEAVLNGQHGCGDVVCGSGIHGGGEGPVIGFVRKHPLIAAAGIAAAIAIPIAVSDDDDDPAS